MARNLRSLLELKRNSRDGLGISVLLVEDDSMSLMLLKHTLESAAGLRELDLRIETVSVLPAQTPSFIRLYF